MSSLRIQVGASNVVIKGERVKRAVQMKRLCDGIFWNVI